MNNSDATALEARPRVFGANIGNQAVIARQAKSNVRGFNKVAASCQPESQMDIEDQTLPICQSEAYRDEISRYIFSLESQNVPNYFEHQSQITEHMRGVLLNWIVNVHLKYQLAEETLFLTVAIIDLYLEKQKIQKNRLQLLGITALWIAAKYEQVYQVPKMSNLIHITDSAYAKSDILEMEHKILITAEFGLLRQHPLTYLNLLLKNASFDEKDTCFSKYFCQLSLLDFCTRRKQPRTLVSGIVYLIRRMRKVTPCWDQHLQATTGVSQTSAKTCAKELYVLLYNIGSNPCFHAIRSKYSHQKYHQVGKIMLKHKSQ